jgi:4,5-dihydroxyphthalate decarboxylase
MASIHLTVASSDCDHLRDFTSGEVRAEGIDITYLRVHAPEIFHRFLDHREFDVSELSMGMYVSLVSQGERSIAAIPVFPWRVFRLSSFYIREGGPIKQPEDLAGKRIGVPEWAQTATIYARGWLSDYVGVDLKGIDWFQAGTDKPGRAETVKLDLPPGLRLTRISDRSLSAMLLAGEIDAIISASPPEPFREGNRGVIRLVSNVQAAELKYWDDTGVFPIMHAIVLRREICDTYPWIPTSLMKAFTAAKDNSLARALTFGSAYPIPMHAYYALDAQKRLGKDFFPYGIEPNRTTLEAFLKFAREQGVCHRLLKPEDLFVPQVIG